MLKLLKRRIVLIAVGFVLVAWLIWWGWQFFGSSIEGFPADSVPARLVVIGLVLGIWFVSLVVRRIRASRATSKLMAAVVKQEPKERPSAEAVQLRERFEEAVATLQTRKRGRHSLYELPWYIIIGAPGSGKTTALVNSGLHFPAEQRSGKGALRGVGGTRNCDWWFTDEAVFLDTAGRYTTQDSDAGSDSAAWGEFLALLRRYRQRRPVNGVLVAMSAQDLMVQGHAAREDHVSAVRRRLEELNTKLGIQLPVYLLITKCDLIAGFTEYFDDLTQEGRAQVWGMTFPYEQTRNSEAAKSFPEEFDALVLRLNERVFGRVQEEGDPRRRARAFGFPQQLAALRAPIAEFVTEVFGSTRFDRTILLRGVYFTSGTQEGTPIDRLLGAIGRRFSVAPDAIAPAGRGKAYFIERLLKEVVIPESGLAGVNRRLEVRKAASQLGAYAAMIALAVLGVIAFWVSYSRNVAYVGEVQAAVDKLHQTPPVPANAPAERMLPQLQAVEDVFAVASQYEGDVPWSRRWGLYRGGELGDAARAAYVQVLNGPLLSKVAERFRQRINEYAASPIELYDYLKGYLILLQPEGHKRIDESDLVHLRGLARREWETPSAAEAETGPLMLHHFGNLLAMKAVGSVAPPPDTEALISAARTSVRRASIAQLAYLQLHRLSEEDTAGGFRLDQAAGLRADEVLRRKDGVKLSAPMLSIFTKKGFEEVAAEGNTAKLIAPLAREQWVWGQDLPARSAGDLDAELFDLYEREYMAQWDAVVKAIEVKKASNPAQAASDLELLAGDASPLRNLLKAVDQQTFLVKPAPDKKEGGLFSGATDRLGKIAAPVLGGGKTAARADVARQRITDHFADLHKLVAGEGGGPPPIDAVLKQLGALQEKVKAVGPAVGKTSPVDPASQGAISDLTSQIKATAASLPQPVGVIVNDVAASVEAVVLRGVRGDLANQYAQAVAADCRELVEDRYPLNRTATREATPGDFGRVFGFGGVFDKFFASTIDALAETSRRPWTWRPSIGNAAVGPDWMLRRFETARHIRDNFFRPGSQTLELSFRATPVELDATVTKFVLRIDGQTLEYQHGPEPTKRMKWPGDVGEAIATFFDGSPVPPSIAYTNSNWALFHLIDDAQVQSESETRHVLTFQKNGLTARVRIEADSNRNPFDRRDLVQQFRCGA